MSDNKPDQRQGDRRKDEDPDYQGKERRKGERRGDEAKKGGKN